MSRALILITIAGITATTARADGIRVKAAREAFEFVAKKFGKEVAEEGAEKLAGRIARASARYGDDALDAVRRVGPKAMQLADDAAENAPQTLRLLARHGDDLAPMLARSGTRSLLARHDDEAAVALLKHPGVAEGVIETAGQPAVRALTNLSAQNGRRLAMLAQGRDLARIGRSGELLDVVGKLGDGCMAFVWRNKKILATGAVLAAFLDHPEPFIDGTVRLADSAIEHVAAPVLTPIGEATGELVREEGGGLLAWAVPAGVASLVLAGIAAGLRRKNRNRDH